ncbi:MAG: HlyC/CorC family transporter [Chloroflexi bacterium]|nr:HlyC/CorC family transporter [Chloroflexota bacterium]
MSADSGFGIALLIAALIVFLVAAAADSAIVLVSRTRIRAFAARGLAGAQSLDSLLQERHLLLASIAIARNVAAVLGIAVSTFLVLRETNETWAALTVTMAGTLLVLVVLQTLIRLLVARSPERWGLRLAPAIRAIHLVFGLPVRGLDWAARRLLPAGQGEETRPEGNDRDEDLLRLVEMHEGNESGENDEMTMIRRIAHMVDKAVREIMVPRIDIVAVDTDANVDDVLSLAVEKGLSRIPLYEETVDNIIGVVYAKDLLAYLANGSRGESLREIARPPYFIPEGKHVDELLAELRQNRVHMAIVVDEYGGTAGLVTIEDVLEEIVGEIQDEYDREEVTVERVSETEAIIDARVSLDELNELFSLEIEGEDFDTLGGFVYHQLGRMPTPGDEVRADGLTMRVLSVLGRRIKKVRVRKVALAKEETD